MAEGQSDDSHEDRVRSEFFLDVFSGDLTIPENLGEQTSSDGLATMDRNNSTSAIGVPEEVVTSFDANQVKTQAAKCLDKLRAVE